jgi:hypothetical protein
MNPNHFTDPVIQCLPRKDVAGLYGRQRPITVRPEPVEGRKVSSERRSWFDAPKEIPLGDKLTTNGNRTISHFGDPR